MSNFTFLTEEQCFGSNQLDVIKKRGTKAAISDFSILLGGYVSDSYYANGGSSLKDRTGWYWTKTDDGDNDARVVGYDGFSLYSYVNLRYGGSRPALPFSLISEIPTNGVSRRASDGVLEIEYGYYPQQAASKNLQIELERAFVGRSLVNTGNSYTTDSRKYDDYYDGFKAQNHIEYEYRGKRYVRIIANSCYDGREFTLSNGGNYRDGDSVWVEIQPIKWLVDEKDRIMITENLVFAGVQFNKERNYHTKNFDKTDIKKFMDNCFSKDIIQSVTSIKSSEISEIKEEIRKSRIEKLNPDVTDFSKRRRMTDTEIIKSWIDAGQSVLLRGPSGIGKTERLKTLYPDLIYIKLTNNMFPEKVVGSMNLQTGQSIPPDFAKQALISCATDEERKLINENIQNLYDLADIIYERSKANSDKVVIMLDELLNVKPAVQSLVYTLVLNKLVETGKGLKLPANTVIVATGNQKKYSSVAEDLAEPLEKRFDHILDMEPKVGDWVTEYAIPNKVHPSVIGYILSKYISSGRSELITEMDYFYEEPEVGEKHLDRNGCKGRTNDPRGWVSISNTLYAFETDLMAGKFAGKDVENMLQISISSKLREEWAREFFDFYNIPTLSVEEVVGQNYSQADLPRDINERFACVTSLLLADESQVGVCREFIRQHCDPEYLQLYDICWIGKDESRMEKISELQELSMFSDNMSIMSEGVGQRR